MAKNAGINQFIAGASVTNKVSLAPAAKDRTKVVITIDSGVGYVTTSGSAAGGVGEVVTSNAPLVYTLEEDGDIVHQAFYGSTSTSTAKFGVREVFGED